LNLFGACGALRYIELIFFFILAFDDLCTFGFVDDDRKEGRRSDLSSVFPVVTSLLPEKPQSLFWKSSLITGCGSMLDFGTI